MGCTLFRMYCMERILGRYIAGVEKNYKRQLSLREEARVYSFHEFRIIKSKYVSLSIEALTPE